MGRRGRRAPLVARCPARSSTTASATAARRARSRDGDPLPDGPRSTAGALDRDEREPSLMLYTSGTTGRPKGVPRSHRADRAGGAVAGHPARLRYRRADARGDAALPHDGHPLAARDAPRRRLLRPPGALGPDGGARADRRAAHQRAVPRADALLRPARAARPRARRHLVGARARVRGRGDDVEPRRALLPGARPGDVRQPLRVDRDLHVHDRHRAARRSPAAPAVRRSTRACG